MSATSSSAFPLQPRPTHLVAVRCAKALALLLSTSALMMLDDPIQQLFTTANQAQFQLNFGLGVLAFNIGLWLCGSRVLVGLILVLLAGMELIQLGHISYFGRPLDPMVLGSLFSDFDDIQVVARTDWADHWFVVPSVLLPYSVAFAIFMKWLQPLSSGYRAIALRVFGIVLIAAGLLSKPYRATYRDINSFLPGPTRSSLHNSINTFSFFAVNGVMHRPPATIAVPAPIVTAIHSDARHIWLIVADSLRGDHMGVLGYPRNTTPLLSARHDLIARPGIAGGVATAVSLPLMINAVREPGQLAQIRDLSTNLFRLAKASGFKTYWISSQESKLLNDLGSKYIDVSITRDDVPERFVSQGDDAILSIMDEQKWADKTFVVVMLRTAHAPYEANYEHARQFAVWPDGEDLPRDKRLLNAYDNSILYLDSLIDRIINRFDALSGPRHLIVTGDHAEMLGYEGQWGHNVLEPDVAKVPVLSLSRDAGKQSDQALRDDKWVSHAEMTHWLAGQLGYQIHYPDRLPGVNYMQGKNLYGANTFREIREGASLEFSAIVPVGHALPVGAATAPGAPVILR